MSSPARARTPSPAAEERERVIRALRAHEAELERRFGGMLRTRRYGAPPHGGIAPGIDRIVMLIANQPNLREVTAFPLNQQAEELLLGAPSRVSERHLRELHIQLSMTAREALREEEERATQGAEAEPKAATG